MRLLKDCTIVELDDNDEHGAGVIVWLGDRWGGYLGRFQKAGMKVHVLPQDDRFAGKTHPDDTLVVFLDSDHRDAHWQAFREAMLNRHRVYIPDDLHTMECDKNGIAPILLWGKRWLPSIVFLWWAFMPIALWALDMPLNLGAALSLMLVSLMALALYSELRKGRV